MTSGSRHIVYLPLFDSDFWATVIFKRCHFVLYTVRFFWPVILKRRHFYMLHCLDGIFLASHFSKVPFCILQFGPVFLPQSFSKGVFWNLALFDSDFLGHSHF